MAIAIITSCGTPKPGYAEQAFRPWQESFGPLEALKQEGQILSYETFGFETATRVC